MGMPCLDNSQKSLTRIAQFIKEKKIKKYPTKEYMISSLYLGWELSETHGVGSAESGIQDYQTARFIIPQVLFSKRALLVLVTLPYRLSHAPREGTSQEGIL